LYLCIGSHLHQLHKLREPLKPTASTKGCTCKNGTQVNSILQNTEVRNPIYTVNQSLKHKQVTSLVATRDIVPSTTNQIETEKLALYRAATDTARLAEWEFHNAVLAMKEFVRGQYGSDSNEAQAVGLKKKSDRKRPTRQKVVAAS